MSTFAARMLEAKHAKLNARNRGQSIGNYRGLAPRTPQVRYGDMDELEIGIARIVTNLADIYHGFAADLDWIVCDLNNPNLEIPF